VSWWRAMKSSSSGRLRATIAWLRSVSTSRWRSASAVRTSLGALRHREVLTERNHAIVARNLPLLDDFIARHQDTFEWVRPTASPIGFPRVKNVGDVEHFCERLAAAGVLLLPGAVYDEPDHVRMGYGRANMPEALRVLEENLP